MTEDPMSIDEIAGLFADQVRRGKYRVRVQFESTEKAITLEGWCESVNEDVKKPWDGPQDVRFTFRDWSGPADPMERIK